MTKKTKKKVSKKIVPKLVQVERNGAVLEPRPDKVQGFLDAGWKLVD